MYHLWVVLKGKNKVVLQPYGYDEACARATKVAYSGKVDRAEVRTMDDGRVVFSVQNVKGYIINNC